MSVTKRRICPAFANSATFEKVRPFQSKRAFRNACVSTKMNLVRRCGSRFSFSVIDFVSPVAKVRAQDHHRRERTRVALPARQCTLTQPLSLEPSLKATKHLSSNFAQQIYCSSRSRHNGGHI